jgi:hypothetical protein
MDDNNDPTVFGSIGTSRGNKKNDIKDGRQANNIQRNESLDKYRSLPLVLKLPHI